MIEPSMFRQARYDAATRTEGDRLIDLIDAVGRISAVSLGLTSAAHHESLRSLECPPANPLNHLEMETA